MDYEETKRRQRIRVLIAEIGMAIAVMIIVTVATLTAMGFFISENGRIEQSGLMQIHSIPTGATVELDGTTLFARTNLSRTMSAGDHRIKITRSGYDEWEKTLHMYPGVLIRLYYPRLFLQDRVPEVAKSLVEGKTADLEFYSPSVARNYIIYAKKGATTWQLMDVRGDEVRTANLDMSKILPGVSKKINTDAAELNNQVSLDSEINNSASYHFDGKVENLEWSRNEERILLKVSYQGKNEWILVNLRNLEESLNLTRTFGLDFEEVALIDNAATKLYALENQHFRQINVASRSMSKILLNNVKYFANNGANVIYVATEGKDQKKQQLVGVYRDGDEGGTILATVEDSARIQVALARYFDEDYMCYIVDRKPTILYGTMPAYSEDRRDLAELKSLTDDLVLSEIPESLTLSNSDEYLVAQKGKKFMVIDLDRGDLFEYVAPDSNLRWLDDSMMYAVVDDAIEVWDFDGTNQRDLSESVKEGSENHSLLKNNVMISSNNRWLYYLTKADNSIDLIRERIRD